MFEEKQSIISNPWVRWVVTFALLFGIAYLSYIIFYFESQRPETTLLIFLITVLSILLLAVSLALETRIDEQGVKIMVKPFYISRQIKWPEIQSTEVRKFIRNQEFGDATGPGILFGTKGRIGYLIKGDDALVIETSVGQRIVIGTQKPRSLLNSIQNFQKKN